MSSNLLLIFLLTLLGCRNSANKKSETVDNKNDLNDARSNRILGYNFSDPDETIFLPAVLHEISGITVIDSSSVACVQDENGVVFIFDVLRKEIKKQIFFHGNGDYEGITQVNGTIYVLRSDGMLFEIKNLETSDLARSIPLKGIPHNNEGLCYDEKNNRLLIAPKDKPKKDSDAKGERVIYGFDLDKGELIKKPVFDFDLSVIKKFASENKVFRQVESKKNNPDNKPEIKFRPSAIGINPLTYKLFILSGMEQMLFVFNIYEDLENIIQLDPKIYNMPEGITFFRNGDMLISNEGQNGNATLIRLNYNPE